MKTRGYQVILLVLCAHFISVTALEEEISDSAFDNFLELIPSLRKERSGSVSARFSLRKPSDPDDDVCYIVTGDPESLKECDFNTTSKTFLVIHGWTVSGLFEGWVGRLVAALYEREPSANVIVVDWLSTAQNHYIVAAHNTKMVGQNIANFINWMEKTTHLSLDHLHLIGYSLGAHVAGFAGNHVSNKIGRITGLDPAGPDFEGAHAHQRLSPDDAHFVDVLHTFNRGSLGLSIGTQQPVGHVDFYPNGGSFQPGCNLRGALEKIAKFGIFAINDAVKCEHERSVHLFIDSLLHKQEASQAYFCGSPDMFERGACLSCRKSRCSTMGYDVGGARQARSATMFTKTRASMPFRVYHYQLKIHFSSNLNCSGVEPTLTVSLHGANGDAKDLHLNINEKIAGNNTHSFLLVTEKDIGELLMIKLKWENRSKWTTSFMLKMVSSWWPGDSTLGSDMEVHKIRVKAGETQKRMVFCLKNPETPGVSQELSFVKCKESWKFHSKRRGLRRQ
uniref:triacylglycerol lipase n=1 Tax=Paramormyrops kingsleyae TaxID=1676925 RepID=A0A3B3SB03_9TELE|nr:lipoprotein lipase-like isoform X1 [Paramormyrops kingsleyae]